MERTEMLCKNYEFERVFRKGRYYNSKHLTLYVRSRQDHRLMLGITVSKQVKGSVRRNQVKRWLREVYRSTEQDISSGYDLILFGRKSPEETNYHELLTAWQKLSKDAHITADKADIPD